MAYFSLNIISLPLITSKGSFIVIKNAECGEDKYTETGGI